jgi:serine/threonine protein kinase
MAPEVVKQRYGPKADVWSLGIVACMVLNYGEQPFKATEIEIHHQKRQYENCRANEEF